MAGQMLQFKVGQDSHTGLQRKENQDSFGWFSTGTGELFVVADGMGGTSGGRVAADMAIAALRQTFEQAGKGCADLLRQGIEKANQQVMELAQREAKLVGMGSTLVAMAYQNGLAYIAHVGDSRLYMLRQGRLTRLTRDHSKVQGLIDSGQMSEAAAEQHPDAHVITRCVGGGQTINAEIRSTPIICQPGDCFLLCTDGLSSLVNDKEIAGIIAIQNGFPATTCHKLVKLALERGGHDNVTLQLICFAGQVTKPILAAAPAGQPAAPTPNPSIQLTARREGNATISAQTGQLLTWPQLLVVVGLLLLLFALAFWWVILRQTSQPPAPEKPLAIEQKMPDKSVISGHSKDRQPRRSTIKAILPSIPGIEVQVESAQVIPAVPSKSVQKRVKVESPPAPPPIEARKKESVPQQIRTDTEEDHE